ncbi:DNA-3-methyladenine glycosylase family protein [Halogeometricum limi]|uniref:DNA-3-methyladenine glycosylase II n=1 Tax=Halogeometricum limi TaxID=555875 RepID=A0A1I6G200_9EURY|nr:3-methyladenine DNA glycosylase [Halogeometricum limi]SFR36206.1 DNA-3-methyladenine glycosylase II [Halogeometricum limi]
MTLTGDTTLALPTAAPFDFDQSVRVLSRSAPCARGRACGESTLVTGGFAPDPFVARVTSDGRGAVRAHVEWLDGAGDGTAVAASLEASLSLSDDLSRLYEAARTDEAFAPVVRDLFGYHHVRFSTPFEAACWAAVSRQTSSAVAARRHDALARSFGRVVAVGDETVSLFPTPAMVRTRADAVRETLGDDRTTETVLALADTFLDETLADRSTPDLTERLGDVERFDPRAAEFVARRGFGRLDASPTHDDGFRAVVADRYGLDDVTGDEVDRLAARYGDQRGYWAHYLRVWDSLRSGSRTPT